MLQRSNLPYKVSHIVVAPYKIIDCHKPRSSDLMATEHLSAEIDPKNTGVIIIHLNSVRESNRGMNNADFPNEISDRQETCSIQ